MKNQNQSENQQPKKQQVKSKYGTDKTNKRTVSEDTKLKRSITRIKRQNDRIVNDAFDSVVEGRRSKE